MKKTKYLKILTIMSIVCYLCIPNHIVLAQTVATVSTEQELRDAVANSAYTDIRIDTDEITLTSPLEINRSIKFIGNDQVSVLKISGNIKHININDSVTLEFDNVSLIGRKTTTDDLANPGGGIYIKAGIDTLTLVNAVIKNCYNPSYGGAVSCYYPSGEPEIFDRNLIISGSKTDISGNTAARGGAVWVNKVTMNDGTISGNIATGAGKAYGGGIYAYGGFTMNGGTITDNHSIGGTITEGGGVCAGFYGDVIINDGTISNNTAMNNYASSIGGGVSTLNAFAISGGTISHNTADGSGGGVYANDVDIKGGVIDFNTTSGNGGGILGTGSFAMSNGIITNNQAAGDGGGIYISAFNPNFDYYDVSTYDYNAIFPITGGTIDGNTALRNGGGIYTAKLHYNASDLGTTADINFTNSLNISGGTFNHNSAVDGGGIYSDSDINEPGGVNVSGNTEITNNIASGNGGGIWIKELSNLIVGSSEVIFSGNSASAAYMIREADIALHQTNIKTTHFTSPFRYAYNNYDVNYIGDSLYVTYTVTYDANGAAGNVPIDNNQYTEGDTVTVKGEGELTIGGKVFAGWNTMADGTGMTYKEGETFIMPANDVVLYASWINEDESTTQQNEESTTPQNDESTTQQNDESTTQQNNESTTQQNNESTTQQNNESTTRQNDEGTLPQTGDGNLLFFVILIAFSGILLFVTRFKVSANKE